MSLNDEWTDASASDVTRALPHAVGPEKSVLSSMLTEPVEFIGAAVEAGLTAEHFYLPAHTTLFGVLLEMSEAGEDIELIALIQKLLDRGLLDRVGGPAAVYDINNYAVTPAHFRHHLQMVVDKAILRGVIQAANEAIAEAYSMPEQPSEVLDAMDSRLSALRADGATQTTMRRVKQDVDEIVVEIMDMLEGREPDRPRGILTGYDDIDRMTGGLIPGEVFVIAARPSVGKTSLMMNIVEHVTVVNRIPSLTFSLEMPRSAVVRRMVFGRSRIALQDMRNGKESWNRGELIRFQTASKEVASAPLWLDDRSGLTIQEIRAKARRAHREHGIRMIAVDYLQLVRSRSKQAAGSREREIAEISAGLKEIAKEIGVPVLVLAQLNRDVEKRSNSGGRPRLSDLRESGAIEQDADVIAMLWRRDYQAAPEDAAELAGQATLSIAKNRNGETGDCPLTFISKLCRFETGEPVRQEPTQPQTQRSHHDR